jgi:ABC-2 type transport system ATP-binding protein
MEQVEEICEHIVLINKGANVLEGPVTQIKNRFKENLFQIDYQGDLPADLDNRVNIVQRTDQRIIVQIDEDRGANTLLQHLIHSGVRIKSYHEILPTLNEIFIKQVESANSVIAEQA